MRDHTSETARRGANEVSELEVVIRRAATEDAAPISLILRAAFEVYRETYTAEAFAATALTPAKVDERLREGPVWLASSDGTPVGTASALVTPQGCYVRGMAVMPHSQARGVGRLLLEAVEEFARAEALKRLYLSTTPFLDRAISLYSGSGFDETSGGPFHLYGTPLINMAKELPDDMRVTAHDRLDSDLEMAPHQPEEQPR